MLPFPRKERKGRDTARLSAFFAKVDPIRGEIEGMPLESRFPFPVERERGRGEGASPGKSPIYLRNAVT